MIDLLVKKGSLLNCDSLAVKSMPRETTSGLTETREGHHVHLPRPPNRRLPGPFPRPTGRLLNTLPRNSEPWSCNGTNHLTLEGKISFLVFDKVVTGRFVKARSGRRVNSDTFRRWPRPTSRGEPRAATGASARGAPRAFPQARTVSFFRERRTWGSGIQGDTADSLNPNCEERAL